MTLTRLPFPRRQRPSRHLVLGTIAHAINDGYTAFLPALLPIYFVRFGLDVTVLAGLVAVFTISSSLPGPIFGDLADRIGRRQVAAGSVLFTALMLSLLATAPSLPLLFALVSVAGFGSAAIHPAGSMLVRHGSRKPELAVALFSAGGMLGYAAGPTVLSAAGDLSGGDMALVLALPGVITAAAMMLLLPQDRPFAPVRRATSLFDWRLLLGPVGVLALVAAFASLPMTATLNGLGLLLMERDGLAASDPLISRNISIYSLAAAAGGIGIGVLAARLPRGMVVMATLLGGIPINLALMLIDPASPLFVAALIGGGLLGFGTTPLLVVTAQDLAPRSGAAAAGIVFGVGAALTGLLYLGLGAVQSQYGAGTTMMIAYTAPIVGAVILHAQLRRQAIASPAAGASIVESICACLVACSGAAGAGGCTEDAGSRCLVPQAA
jgi:FSR family fosmidomycin resistance protein-like MFS transporter